MTKIQAVTVAIAEACGADLSVQLTEREIAMIAWRRFPEMFCIRGYAEHPDTKMISVLLANTKHQSGPPKHHGWIEKAAKGRWRLTHEGALEAQRIAEEAAV